MSFQVFLEGCDYRAISYLEGGAGGGGKSSKEQGHNG